jgi:hypothetical protein
MQFFRRRDVGSASFFLTGKSLVIPLRADFTTRLSGIILISEAMFAPASISRRAPMPR